MFFFVFFDCKDVIVNHFRGGLTSKLGALAALQGYNLVEMVVNFEDGGVEEEIDRFNNKNNVKLNN